MPAAIAKGHEHESETGLIDRICFQKENNNICFNLNHIKSHTVKI